MKKALQCLVILGLMFAFGAGSTLAGDQPLTNSGKADTSTRLTASPDESAPNLAANQNRRRDRKKDGSCQLNMSRNDQDPNLAANQNRRRDRKKDGSCQLNMSRTGGELLNSSVA